MAKNLQNLLKHIQKEGVAKAEAEAEKIIDDACKKARDIVEDSKKEAADNLRKAEKDALAFTERSKKTLEQAARDLIITIGGGIENILKDIVSISVGKSLDPETMVKMMVKIASSYAEKGYTEGQIEMLINEADQKKVVKYFMEKYRKKLEEGIEIRTDNNIISGFRVSLGSNKVFHDFTEDSISKALCYFLRPHLAEIVHNSAHGKKGKK